MRLAIFGAGGFGREIVKPAREQLIRRFGDSGADRLVFVSDDGGGDVLGVPVVTPDQLEGDDEIVIALGSSEARRDVARRLKHIKAGQVVASTAVLGPGVQLGEGAVLCDFTMVTASATIGRQFQCNIYSYVAHDCVIGDFVTFAPRVCCNGNVHVGDGAYIGTGAVLKQGSPNAPLVVGMGAIVGMGAVVTKDVPAGATVVGNPARPFERRR